MADRYDVIIVGGGQAGIPLAHQLARTGRQVALAERKHLGGSCVNFGCTPTKAAIASARVAHLARRAGEYGVVVPSVAVDFARVIERAQAIATQSRTGLEGGFTPGGNPRLLTGHARLAGKLGADFRLEIDGREVLAGQVVLDTGTRSNIPPMEGLAGIEWIDSENWLDRRELPAHLGVIGGGYIGLEMAQFYRRMGSRVTVIQHGGQIAEHEDRDVAEALQRLLEAEGIEFRLEARVTRVDPGDRSIGLHLDTGDRLSATDLFIAIGRKANADDLGLETVGVQADEHGIVQTDQRLATSVPGIWAAGDIRGGPMFTHTSWDDYRILASQIASDGSRTLERVVPYAVFTDPELGRVGLTESQAREAGHRVRVARFDMADNGKAKELGETGGFVKLVADETSGKLLGAAVLAVEGSELVHLFVELMNADAPYAVMERAIHIHPTLAEAMQSAVTALG